MRARFLGVMENKLASSNHNLSPKVLLFAMAICSISLFASTGWGTETYYVSVGGGGDCINTPCSFQEALDKAKDDGEDSTIIVAPGTYNIAQTLKYVKKGGDRELTIQAQNPNNRPILDGNHTVQIMNIDNAGNESEDCEDVGANITINGLIFKNGNTDFIGGGLAASACNATVKVINSRFENNTSDDGGGGAALGSTSGRVILSNSYFSQNKAHGDIGGGGAFLVSESSSITVSDSTFSENKVDSADGNGGGGALLISESGNLTISNSSFENNTSDSVSGGGGAVLASENGRSTVSNSHFSQNKAIGVGGGGALLVSVNGTLTVSDSTFKNNTSENNTSDSCVGGGGALLVSNGSGNLTISSSYFENNTSDSVSGGGGAALVSENGTITVNDSTFSENKATADSGGGGAMLFSVNGSVTVSGSHFSQNNAGSYGGGAALGSGSNNLTVSDSTFSQNNATDGGGIFVEPYNSTSNIINNSFYHNTAASGDSGGGIYAYLGTENDNLNLYNNILWQNSANGSGNDVYVRIEGNSGFQNIYNNDFSCNDFDGNSDCLLIDNTTNYQHGSNISQDPLFANPDNGDLHLTSGSPCIDGGCNTAPQIPASDFEGNKRILDGDGDRIPVVDMGADEYQPVFFAPPAAPSDVEASASGCQAGCVASVTLTWKAVRGAEGYLIYNADANQLWKWVKDGTATSHTFNNLPCGRTYHFYLKTHSYTGNSQPSKTVAVQIPACSGSGGTGTVVSLAWPKNNSAINYNDFDAADYLVVFAWNHVENAKGYLLWLKLDDGTSTPLEASVVLSASNGLIEAGNLAGIYFALDKAGWNSLAPYKVTWQISALSDPNNLSSILATSPKASFTFNEAK